MIQLDLFTWRPKYAIPSSAPDSFLRRSTPGQRVRAIRHATNTTLALSFIRQRFK